MRRHNWRAGKLSRLHHGRFGSVRDINDQPDAVHLRNRLAPNIGKPAMFRRAITKRGFGPRGIGQIIMPVMRQRQINRAEVSPKLQPRQIAAHGIAVFNRAQHRKRAGLMRGFQVISAGAKAPSNAIGAHADVAQHRLGPVTSGLMAGNIARARMAAWTAAALATAVLGALGLMVTLAPDLWTSLYSQEPYTSSDHAE